MIKLFKKYCWILLFIAAAECLVAQAPFGEYNDSKVLPNNDTLLINRHHGDWWFGITAGTTLSMYYSDFFLPRSLRSLDEGGSDSVMIDFPTGYGAGLYAGLMFEWIPVREKFAAGLKILLYDNRNASSITDTFPDGLQTKYLSKSSYTYITIMPSARYNFPLPGLYVFAGMELDLLLNNKMEFSNQFKNSGDITWWRSIEGPAAGSRLGAHLGVGYDFLVADINKKFRVDFSPYISLHAGSKIYDKFNSSLHTAFARVGLSIKFGPDVVNYDTLKFDPNYKMPPVLLASIPERISFPGFRWYEPSPVMLAYVETPKVVAAVSVTPTVQAAENVEKKAPKSVKPAIRITPGEMKRFQNYNTTTDVVLKQDMKDYLDAIAQYLQEHPNASVEIVGHSDNQGSFLINDRRSKERSDQAVAYLRKKGISAGRILARGVADLYPLKPNTTESGRFQNRRVEIVIRGR